jgi:hypothetical protein
MANSVLQNCARRWADFGYSMTGLEFRLGEFIWVNCELCEGWLNRDCAFGKLEGCAEQLTVEPYIGCPWVLCGCEPNMVPTFALNLKNS